MSGFALSLVGLVLSALSLATNPTINQTDFTALIPFSTFLAVAAGICAVAAYYDRRRK